MAHRGWDGVPVFLAMPAAGGTTDSEAFSVPRGASAVTFYMPALVGTAATAKLQALYPASSAAAETWADVSAFDPATGTLVALDGILEGVVTTLSTALTGGGVLKLVASETQVGAPSTIAVFFHMKG